MIGSDIRFLSYRVGTSFLHRLDPRTKILGVAVIVTDALIAVKPLPLAVALALCVVIGLTAYHLLPVLWTTLRALLVLIALFGVLITVVTPGHAIAHIWIFVPTTDGLHLAIRSGIQAMIIIYTTSFLSLTTPPLDVAAALGWALGFLEKVRVPVREIIAMVAIGLTFVPLLIEETQKVIAAQRARGADLGIYALLDEQAMGALMIPLLLANLRRGDELAESMEARLFATGPRTSLRQWRFGRDDLLVALVLAAFSIAIVVLSFWF
jgi:energy-coupling factor transport system permease protein